MSRTFINKTFTGGGYFLK